MESKNVKMLALTMLGILTWVGSSEAAAGARGAGDSWELVVPNAGVSAMHMALTHTNRVIMFDRTDYGPSQIKLPGGYCRKNNNDLALKVDCWAHSIEYDIASNKIRPLTIFTDTWCSSGAFQPDGSLTQTGGWNDGGNSLRKIGLTATDDWKEYANSLAAPRWYATNQLLPDGRQIVIGGRRQFNYEFVPRANNEGVHALPLLAQTNDPAAENNLYPFVHLSPDNNLFIFANQDSILFNYKAGSIARKFPALPGGPRNYPSSGSSVLLPLAAPYKAAEVLICGGAPAGSFQNVARKKFAPALQTCGRISITDPNPRWLLETMPSPRVMGDMLILPTAEVLIINGAKAGTAGWGVAREPSHTPVLYNPGQRRFQEMKPSTIPRLYHSTAVVLPDGKILVAGSNPNPGYSFTGVLNPTELRIEKYSPYYLYNGYDFRRPVIVSVDGGGGLKYGGGFRVRFRVGRNGVAKGVGFHLYAPPFVTHSYSMNQRMLVLGTGEPVAVGGVFGVTVYAPPSAVVAPAGWYLLFPMNAGTPGAAAWVHIG